MLVVIGSVMLVIGAWFAVVSWSIRSIPKAVGALFIGAAFTGIGAMIIAGL